MQTILGSTGVIGTGLAKSLYKSYTKDIRLVSRNPKAVNPSDTLFKADLTDEKQTLDAVKGSEIVYLTPGLEYKTKVWQEQWPKIMQNVIKACEAHGSKLVFFDNVYSYGRVKGWMTEETPYNPCSKKGEVRVKIAEMLMDEVKKGNLKAQIARAADFYGPDTPMAFTSAMVFDNLAKGKKAQWIVNANVKHTLTYTPDAGKATAILGNTETAYNQVWHLPSDRNSLSGKEFIDMAVMEFGATGSFTTFSPLMIKIAGLFMPVLKESVEMLYQYKYEYLFSSEKFENKFGFVPTSYEEGIKETVNSYK